MSAVIGDLLPLALGVAISPMPIIAVILMLLAPKAGGMGAGFLAGWVAGLVVATVAFLLLTGAAGLDADSDPSATVSWVKIALGALLLVLAVQQWRHRPAEPAMPSWMTAIESLRPAKAVGFGLLLSAVNPKNLAMTVTAGVTIGGGAVTTGEVVVAVAVFTVIAASSVALPVVCYAFAHERMAGPLDTLRHWLVRNNPTVMATLLLVIGVVVVGKGVSGLS